jgi:hypothetical protein
MVIDIINNNLSIVVFPGRQNCFSLEMAPFNRTNKVPAALIEPRQYLEFKAFPEAPSLS